MVPLVEVRFRLNGWPRPHGRGKRASNEMADLGQRSAVVGSDTVDNTLLIVRKRWESRSGESPSSAATLMLSGCAPNCTTHFGRKHVYRKASGIHPSLWRIVR